MTLRVNGQILMLSDLKQSTGESRDVPEGNPHRQACECTTANDDSPTRIQQHKTACTSAKQATKKPNAIKNIGGAFTTIRNVVSGHSHVQDGTCGKHPTYSTKSNCHWQYLCATQLGLIANGDRKPNRPESNTNPSIDKKTN